MWEDFIIELVKAIIVGLIVGIATYFMAGRKKPIIGTVSFAIVAIAFLFFHAFQLLTIKEIRSHFDFMYQDFFNKGGTIILSNPPMYKYMTRTEVGEIEERKGRTLAEMSDRELHDYGVVHMPILDICEDRRFDYLIKSKEQYVGMGEALISGMISRLFFRISENNPVTIQQSRVFALAMPENIILLGGWVSNAIAFKYLNTPTYTEYEKKIPYRIHDGCIYRYDSDVQNETALYRPRYVERDSGLFLGTDYAVITKVKNIWDGTTIIICAGINSQGTQAAGDIISNIDTTNGEHKYKVDRLKAFLESKLREVPQWFQVIIGVPVRPVRDIGLPGENIEYIEATKISF